MKSLVFDTSSIITLATNDLLWCLKPMREMFNGEFCIPASVKRELVDVPLKIRRFRFEAMMINKIIGEELKVYDVDTGNVLDNVNSVYSSKENMKVRSPGGRIKILDKAEVDALLLADQLKGVYVVDERTLRMFVEEPENLRRLLENKLHTKISMDSDILKRFRYKVDIIRSTELMTVALENGLLDHFVKNGNKKDILDGLLWGLRLRGCAISTEEINDMIKLVK